MRSKRFYLSCVVFLVLGFTIALGMFGCKSSPDSDLLNVRVNGQVFQTDHRSDITSCVSGLNSILCLYGDETGIRCDVNDELDDYSVYIGEYLEKILPLICENYNASTNWSENITPEEVKMAINDDFLSTLEVYRSGDWRSFFIYKLFYWCGYPCKETAVYNPSSGEDQAETEKWISYSWTTNIDVIRSQVYCSENGLISDVKFKWQ